MVKILVTLFAAFLLVGGSSTSSREDADISAHLLGKLKSNPTSEESFSILERLLLDPDNYHRESGPELLQIAADYHATNSQMGKVLSHLGYYFPWEEQLAFPAAMKLMREAAEKNPDRTVRAQASIALARYAKRNYERDRRKPGSAKLHASAISTMEEVIRNYGDVPYLRTLGARPPEATVAKELKSDLYELKFLQEGQPAPVTKGEDLAGKSMNLSDYRGKVVMLVFWASWCGPCMAEVPHEIEIVNRFKDRPFVLVGVNGDGKKEEAERAVAKHSIPWRSFWNGPEGSGGALTEIWNVRSWPSVFVIDGKGVIRHTRINGKRLDDAITALVEETEKEKRPN